MKASETKVDVLGVLREFATKRDPFGSADEAMRKYIETRDAVAELIDAATKASATLGHVYHTVLLGEIAEYAREDYQRLDAALARIGAGQ